MATIQIQKNKNVGPITKTAIDQKQSLEVVQTMLHGGLSTLSYLRNFFAEKAYDQHVYEMRDKVLPYDDYAAGKMPTSKKRSGETSTIMQVLQRNRSRRVDMFLDWLENGAFTALKANNLRSLQIYVHGDPKCREKVIETYIFNIKYTQHEGEAKQSLAGLEIDRSGNSMISVEATNASLQSLLRKIMELCKSLPDLPEQRFISMALFYMHDTRTQDRPDGFVPNMMEPLLFAEADGWERHTESLQEVLSGFHGTSLAISHLQKKNFQLHSGFAGLVPPAIPATVQYKIAMNQWKGTEVAHKRGLITEIDDTVDLDETSTDDQTPSSVVEHQHSPAEGEQLSLAQNINSVILTPLPTSDVATAQTGALQRVASTSERKTLLADSAQNNSMQPDGSFNTQSSGVLEMKKALNGMMHSENMTQGDTQTQYFPAAPQSDSTETQDLADESPTKSTLVAPKVNGNKFELSQHIAKVLNNSKANLRQTAIQLAKTANLGKKTTDLILCQCKHPKDEGDMVNCAYCGTWQHLHCYGYTGAKDPRLLDNHVCYQCLLGQKEEGTLKTLRGLALIRRGMHVALVKGLRTQRDFATDMGVQASIAGPIYQHLKKEGYVVSASGSHSAGHAASGKPLFVAVKQGTNHEKMVNDLFEPLMHISHHYELPAQLPIQTNSLTQHLLASQPGNMPPPVTPASQMKKRGAKTPGSALDLRESTIPFETPSRPKSRQTLPSKRRREEDDGDNITITPKRRAAPGPVKPVRSVQTEFILDAGGLSSSPAGPVSG